MADFTFNIAKGRFVHWCTLPAANDALIIIPIEASAIEADATMKDYDNASLLIAGTSNEQITLGRKTAASVVVTVDDTNDRVDVDFADVVWTAGTGNAVGKLLVCYDPDTTAGTDADLLVLTAHDFSVTPNGSDITATVAAAGFARAS